MRRAALGGVLLLLVGACASHAPVARTAAVASAAPVAAPAPAELVESAPVETTLDHPDVANAADVWIGMIDGARRSLDIGAFYVSDAPGSRMHAVLEAIERAADRGVHVRLLVEQIFYPKYPESVDMLARHAGVEVRHFDMSKTMGGILHAKYFVVDRREAYVGSQNLDWRSLEHIQEMGVRLRSPALAGELDDLFQADWDVMGGAPPSRWRQAWRGPVTARAAGLSVTLGLSPDGFLPDPSTSELSGLVRWMDATKERLDVQVLTYKAKMRDGSPFPTLDDALRRAAGRGVHVRLLVSSWGAKAESLHDLAKVAGVEVRVITIPPWSGGDIPFARVAHAKYALFDDDRAWVGTGNWEGDYFLRSRDVSAFVQGRAFAAELRRVFEDGWSGKYAAPLGAAR